MLCAVNKNHSKSLYLQASTLPFSNILLSEGNAYILPTYLKSECLMLPTKTSSMFLEQKLVSVTSVLQAAVLNYYMPLIAEQKHHPSSTHLTLKLPRESLTFIS